MAGSSEFRPWPQSHFLRGPSQSAQIEYMLTSPLSIIPILKLSKLSLCELLNIIQPMSLNLIACFIVLLPSISLYKNHAVFCESLAFNPALCSLWASHF